MTFGDNDGCGTQSDRGEESSRHFFAKRGEGNDIGNVCEVCDHELRRVYLYLHTLGGILLEGSSKFFLNTYHIRY